MRLGDRGSLGEKGDSFVCVGGHGWGSVAGRRERLRRRVGWNYGYHEIEQVEDFGAPGFGG